jgi:hypothetical protein
MLLPSEFPSFVRQTQSNAVSAKRGNETAKLTKHGFLDKIKAAAKTSQAGDGGDEKTNEREARNQRDSNGNKKDIKETGQSSWGALKDDYMLNPKKVSRSEQPVGLHLCVCQGNDLFSNLLLSLKL